MTSAEKRDYELLARELVRALRGRRSQLALSRRLGYSTNALYNWEAGVAWPAASRFFELARRVGVDLDGALRRFFREIPGDLRDSPLTSPEGVRRLLVTLRGRTQIGALARASGISRYALSRWLHGKAQPRLPELLRYVEHSSFRLPDFLAVLVDPEGLPSVRDEWARLESARSLGYESPFAHAVLRALELESYRKLKRHQPGVLAAALGISAELEQECLQKLARSGQVHKRRGLWEPHRVELVDFRREPEAAQRLKAFWAQVAAKRCPTVRGGLSAYNVFAVSRSDLARIQALQRELLLEIRTIIAASQPSEVVALGSFQIFALEG